MRGNDNRKIAWVFWPDTENEQGRYVQSGGESGQLMMINEYHGDHDEDWIVQIKDGVEIARYNPRFVESITWAEEHS